MDGKLPPEQSQSERQTKRRSSIRRHRRGGAKSKLLILLILFVGLVWAAPIFVAHSPLLGNTLNSAVAKDQGSLAAGSASLGWFSPVVLTGVELRDAQGELLASSPEVRSEKTLLQLAMDSLKLGKFTINDPEIHISLRKDGSNWEDFLAPFLQQKGDSPLPTLAVVVNRSKIHIQDETNKRQWEVDPLNCNFQLLPKLKSNAKLPPCNLQLDAVVQNEQSPAKIAIDAKLGQHDLKTGIESSRGHLEVDGLPLKLVESYVARLLPDAHLSGSLTSKLQFTWGTNEDPEKIVLEGSSEFGNLLLTSSALGRDRLYLQKVSVPCQIVADKETVTVRRAEILSDIGNLQIGGALPRTALADDSITKLISSIELSVAGKLDLVQLAALLPETLHVREHTNITSGSVEIALRNEQDERLHSSQLTGRLITTPITAISRGKRYGWEKPIDIRLLANVNSRGATIEKLSCDSDFLQVQAKGTLGKLEGKATYDLGQLQKNLEQFFSLEEMQLAGHGESSLSWTRMADSRFQTAADFLINDFKVMRSGQHPWHEKQLQLQLAAVGKLLDTPGLLVQQASANLAADGDTLQLALTDVVDTTNKTAPWPLELHLRGDLARWLPRSSPWLSVADIQLAGDCNLRSRMKVSSAVTEIEFISSSVKNLFFAGSGMTVREPTVELNGRGTWDNLLQRLDLPNATFASRTVSFRAEQILVKLPKVAPPQMSGIVSLNASAERLADWINDPRQPNRFRVAGQLTGDLRLAYQAGRTTAQININGKDFALSELKQVAGATNQWKTVWTEPALAAQMQASYDSAIDRVELRQANINSQHFNLKADGTINKLKTSQDLHLVGTVDYDLQKITPLLYPYLGNEILLVGRDTANLKVDGPIAGNARQESIAREVSTGSAAASAQPYLHWSQNVTATLDFGWQEIHMYGMSVGGGRVNAELGAGMIETDPISILKDQTRLTTQLTTRLDPQPAAIFLPKGPLLTNFQFTPEMVDKSLKFVAPALANATRTEGTFSINLEGARIPLANPKQADVGGMLLIHNVDVLPGPLMNQILFLGQQIEALAKKKPLPTTFQQPTSPVLKVKDSNVEFRMLDGRVHHRGLTLQSGNVLIRTSGSVGLDESLNLVAEIPLDERWVGNSPLLANMKNQTITVGITGTLDQPKVDGRVLQQLAARLLQNTTRNILEKEVGNQLQRLFNPR